MGEIVQNPPTTPNTVLDSWEPLVLRDAIGYFGMNKVTLTNWDATTTRPEIAQGSVIEIDGSLATFDTQEALGNLNPPDGDVYVKFTVTGDTVEARLTGTVPHWDNTKGGWYNASGERYSGHVMEKSGTAYTHKYRARDEEGGLLSGPDSIERFTAKTLFLTGEYGPLIEKSFSADGNSLITETGLITIVTLVTTINTQDDRESRVFVEILIDGAWHIVTSKYNVRNSQGILSSDSAGISNVYFSTGDNVRVRAVASDDGSSASCSYSVFQ